MADRDAPLQVPIGGRLGQTASDFLSGDREVAEPRLASTVLLVRDGTPVDVFMIRRVPTMAFAPSMWVFPGGGVDQRDSVVDVPWAGPSAQQWAQRLGVTESIARELVVAAIREVFEECGVLLAGPDGGTLPPTPADGWRSERDALIRKEIGFAQLAQERSWVLRTDLLAYRDHWITPEFEPRRYDTYFFTALMPERQVADDATTEAAEARWIDPAALRADLDEGKARMLPPTWINLDRLRESPDAAGALNHPPPPDAPVMPVIVQRDGENFLQIEL